MLQDPKGQVLERASLPLWQRTGLLCLAYFVCAWLGKLLSPDSGAAVSYWLPGGLFVAALLVNPTRDWPWLMLSILPANIGFDLLHDLEPHPFVIAGFCTANILQAGTGAWLVRRFIARTPRLASLKEFFGLILFAGGAGSAIGATIGATMLTQMHLAGAFMPTWQVLWGGNVMAVLVLAPMILAFGDVRTRVGSRWNLLRLLEAVVVFGGMAAFLWFVLAEGRGIGSPKIPVLVFVIWAGLRFGLRGASVMVFTLAMIASYLTTHFQKGLSPEELASGSYVFTLQVFVAVAALVGLVPTIVLGERDGALAKLRDSENRYRSLTEAAFEGVFISENGRIVDASDQGVKMFGYERDELIGKDISELVVPAQRAEVMEAVHSQREQIYGHELRRKDGSTFYAEAQARHVQLGGRKLRMTALRDITERKAAEQALRESEEKFSKAFRASPDGLAISELETGRFIEVNTGYCELYGYRREEMLGRTSAEVGLWNDPQDRARLVAELKASGMVRNYEVRMRTRAGVPKVILLSAENIELGGRVCLVSVLHDVTDRIGAEQALRESEEKFSKAFYSSPDAISISDVTTGRFIDVNDGFPQMYGYTREEIIGHTSIELKMWHDSANRDKMLQMLKHDGRIRSYPSQGRMRSGDLFHCLASADLVEIKGRTCIITVVRDISEQKRAEAALRESEESLRATIENTPDVGVQWFNRRAQVVFWNRASETMYGWTSAEAAGKKLDALMFTGEQAAAFEATLGQIERTGKPFGPAEFSFRRRDGKTGVALSTIFQIPTTSNEARFVCMDVDLTRRKQAEALTQTQMQVLEMIAHGQPLPETFNTLLRLMESQSPEMIGSILMLDPDRIHVRHVAASSLPPDFIRSVDGQAIGPCAGSCGTAMFRGEPVFVADIAADPLWVNYRDCALSHGLRACWSTPILDVQQKVMGTFAIYSRTPGLPDEAQRQLIEMATHTTAVCLSKHRIETEREQSIAREHRARIEYTFQLIAAQEAERKRIAAELHDSLGQNLLLIKNLAQMALREQEPAQTYERVASIDHLAAQCIAETRQISRDLHPHQLDHLGLKRALESMLESVAQASVITFQWKIDCVDELFSAEGAMNLYRIVQESLNNILKHSRAKNARVDLERDIHEVQLCISDDGCGFSPGRLAENKKGLGLKNIPERVRMLGGSLKVDSAPGGGTRIDVVIPVAAEPE